VRYNSDCQQCFACLQLSAQVLSASHQFFLYHALCPLAAYYRHSASHCPHLVQPVQPLHLVDCSLFLGLLQTNSLWKLTVRRFLAQPSTSFLAEPVVSTAHANACWSFASCFLSCLPYIQPVTYMHCCTTYGCFDRFQDIT